MSISRTAFRRMITDRREPEWVRREVEHFIEARKKVLARDYKITDRGEYFERWNGPRFTQILKQYREEEREKGKWRNGAQKKIKKSSRPLKKNAIRRGPRLEIRFETLRDSSEIQVAADMRGLSKMEFARQELIAAAKRIIHGE